MTERLTEGDITRRNWLLAVPGLALVPRLLGQLSPAPFSVLGLQQVTLAVADLERSLDFYQRVFGLPVVARTPSLVVLDVGNGQNFLRLTRAGPREPRIDHFGMAVEGFDVDRIVDPNGLLVDLQESGYCGDDRCFTPEPAREVGSLKLTGFSHLTVTVPDPEATNAFYRRVYGLDIQTYQAASPVLGVGPGDHFLMFINLGGPARIHHACLTVEDFTVPGIQTALEEHGVRPREAGASGPSRALGVDADARTVAATRTAHPNSTSATRTASRSSYRIRRTAGAEASSETSAPNLSAEVLVPPDHAARSGAHQIRPAVPG